jgi:ankyrin repeat protein
MAFSWRRIAQHLKGHNRPRDEREDQPTLGRYEKAPAHAFDAPVRACPHDWTDLWGAAALGYVRILRRMLDTNTKATEINLRDRFGRTPLFYAIEDGQTAAAELLLAHGADPDLRDEMGISPLHLSVRRGSSELARLLLKNHATPDSSTNDISTPLMDAVRRGDVALTELLLRSGASVAARDRFGHTPIFYVQGASARATLIPLLNAGARVTEQAGNGDTPIHRALRAGDLRLYRALVPGDDESALLKQKGRLNETLLHAAAEGRNLLLVKRLIRLGSDLDARNLFGHTPLLIALTQESLPISTLLTQSGAEIGFLEAVAMGDYERAVASLPVPIGTHLDAPILGHETPLMGAVARERADLVELLLNLRASPNAASFSIGTPLDVAILTEQAEITRMLLARGANQKKLRHATPAQLRALLAEQTELASDALPQRPPLDATPTEPSALYAAAVESDDAVRFLLLCGARIDVADENGESALVLAARDGDLPAVQRLLALGATLSERVVEAARSSGRTQVCVFLESRS